MHQWTLETFTGKKSLSIVNTLTLRRHTSRPRTAKQSRNRPDHCLQRTGGAGGEGMHKKNVQVAISARAAETPLRKERCTEDGSKQSLKRLDSTAFYQREGKKLKTSMKHKTCAGHGRQQFGGFTPTSPGHCSTPSRYARVARKTRKMLPTTT